MTAVESRTSAVVVHYGPWSTTERTLASLSGQRIAEVLVVDNGALPPPLSLGSARVSLLSPGRNLGYGAACNLGARSSSGDFLLFLNNDVELSTGAADLLGGVLESDPSIAAAAPRLFRPDGRPLRSIGRAPTPRRVLFENLFLPRLLPGIPFFHGHHTALVPHGRSRDVETVLGAAVLVRRSAFERVGGFDEGYFFYAEESDLFERLRRGGWRVRFEPAARAVHRGGVASRSLDRDQLDRWLHEGLRRYARVFHGEAGERRTAKALRTGALLRWALAHLQPGAAGSRRRQRYATILRDGRGRFPASKGFSGRASE